MITLQDGKADAAKLGQELVAEEERIKTKAAAKKQKQKVKKQQVPSQPSSAACISASIIHGPASSSDAVSDTAAVPVQLDQGHKDGHADAEVQGRPQELTFNQAAVDDQDDVFLTQLFCCPLTQVSC